MAIRRLLPTGALVLAFGCAAGPAEASGPGSDGTSGSRIRIVAGQATGSDGTRAPNGFTLYDTLLNVDCTLAPAADGVTRCLPLPLTRFSRTGGISSGLHVTYFADAYCTQQLALLGDTLLSSSSDPCASSPRYLYEASQQLACIDGQETQLWHVFLVGAEHIGIVYGYGATPAGSACAPVDRNVGQRFFGLGPEAAPGSFVSFTMGP